MTERDRGAPDGVGPDPSDPASETAAGAGSAEETNADAPGATEAAAADAIEPTVAGDPIAMDPDLAPSSSPETEVAAPLTPVGPGVAPTLERAAPPEPGPSRRPVDRRAGRAPAPPPLPTPSDQAVHIDDRISKIFVLAAVGVFVLIILNGLLLGRGGTLSASPSPSPVASVSASPAASTSPSSSASPAASGSAGPSGSPAASGSAAPASPSASPAASPS